jgi:hypothetical protein
MELERWAELSAAVSGVAAGFARHKRDEYSTALVVRASPPGPRCGTGRSASWACEAKNWTPHTRPPRLPDRSTMSRPARGVRTSRSSSSASGSA